MKYFQYKFRGIQKAIFVGIACFLKKKAGFFIWQLDNPNRYAICVSGFARFGSIFFPLLAGINLEGPCFVDISKVGVSRYQPNLFYRFRAGI